MTPQQATTKQREFISLSDMTQFEEEILGYRGDKDANAQRSPLPHDNYVFRVQYAENWPASEGEAPVPLASDPNARWFKGEAKDGKVYFMTWIKVTTCNNSNPEHDDYSWTEILTTYPTKQGTTAAQALLQGFDVDTIMLNTHNAQVRALDQHLAGDGTLVGAEVDWIARQFDKNAARRDKQGNPVMKDGQQVMGVETFRLRGMRRFPKNEDGSHRYTIDSADFPKLTEEVRAFNEIRRWIPVSRMNQAGVEQDLAPALEQSVQQVQQAQQMPPTPAPAPVAQTRPVAAAPAPAAPTAPARAAAPVGAVRRAQPRPAA